MCRSTCVVLTLIFHGLLHLSDFSKYKIKKEQEMNVLVENYKTPKWNSIVTMTEYPSPHPGVPGSTDIDHHNSTGVRTRFPGGPR